MDNDAETTKIPPLADPAALVRAMSKAHRRLGDDLRERAGDRRVAPSLLAAYAADKAAGQTGEAYEVYRDGFCDQVAASWVLCAVFVRTLEDRGYLPHRVAGRGAGDKLSQFRSQFRFLGERDYLLHIFDAVSRMPAGREVFGPGHAPLWRLGPTSRAIGDLLGELRAEEGGRLRFTFGRPEGEEHDGASTRYLGDLYEKLDEVARKRFALRQTPEFVERFLLDHTLDVAIRERGIAVTLIDPACGSGHLLLGAYDRLYSARRREQPDLTAQDVAQKALSQVYGIDINPYAAALARFRLLLSYVEKARLPRLDTAPNSIPLQVYVGDSLLAGADRLQTNMGDLFHREAATSFGFEKSAFSFFEAEADKLLRSKRFDVVVANPPYITEKDATKRELIRKHYKAAAGKYALTAPFVERIMELGNEGAYTGQITANSFMKREFGKTLVEDVLPNWDMTAVLDTSGAHIPGHGTPTVILFARAQRPRSNMVRVVMGSRGEPKTPEVPSDGKVWSTIAANWETAGYDDEFISVADIERIKLEAHPWSLGGGGAAELKELLEGRAERRLGDTADSIGIGAVTGEDEVYLRPPRAWRSVRNVYLRPLLQGDIIRDWSASDADVVLFPYDESLERVTSTQAPDAIQALWPYKNTINRRKRFGVPMLERGYTWYELQELYVEKFRSPYSITFAFVATHNHFVLDRGGKVFNRSAPIIKLPEGATEEEHLALLGYLNSAAACFWMKQVSHDKGNRGEGGGTTSEDWERFFEFTGGQLSPAPLIAEALERTSPLVHIARELSALGEQWAQATLSGNTLDAIVTKQPESLQHAIAEAIFNQLTLECRIRALQERLDWMVYAAFGLCSADLAEGDVELRGPAERVSDMLYARKILEEQGSRRYFQLCRLPEPEVVAEQPLSDLDQRRLDAIAESQWLKILEQPAFKRTYRESFRPADIPGACEEWLLDRVEAAYRDSPTPSPLTIASLADLLVKDPKVRAVCEVLTGTPNHDLAAILADLVSRESVASARCQRYTESGLEKRSLWEATWDLQRREDAGEKVTIEVPPKYDQKDFENAATVWRLRGKLDVPKERFIAYPSATPTSGLSGKAALTFGWAGWDAEQQIQAAIELWQREMGMHEMELMPRAARKAREEELGPMAEGDGKIQLDASARERLMPLLQTMADLLPWIRQWHDQDGETASAFEAYVSEQARRLEVSLDEARSYRRPPRVKAVKAAAKKTAGSSTQRRKGKKTLEEPQG